MVIKKLSVSLPEDIYVKAKKSSEDIGATFSGFVKVSLKEKLEKNGTKK